MNRLVKQYSPSFVSTSTNIVPFPLWSQVTVTGSGLREYMSPATSISDVQVGYNPYGCLYCQGHFRHHQLRHTPARPFRDISALREVPFSLCVAGCFIGSVALCDPFFYISPMRCSKLGRARRAHSCFIILSYRFSTQALSSPMRSIASAHSTR
jgi:hypothetical protein